MSMSTSIATFNPQLHLDAAASLLAERHRRDREREPLLPAAYEVPAACRAALEQSLQPSGASGVIAEAGGDFVGFLIGTPQLFPPTHFLASFFPPRSIGISYQSHAAVAGSRIRPVPRDVRGARRRSSSAAATSITS